MEKGIFYTKINNNDNSPLGTNIDLKVDVSVNPKDFRPPSKIPIGICRGITLLAFIGESSKIKDFRVCSEMNIISDMSELKISH